MYNKYISQHPFCPSPLQPQDRKDNNQRQEKRKGGQVEHLAPTICKRQTSQPQGKGSSFLTRIATQTATSKARQSVLTKITV
jgi:hypothetical protein